MGYGNKVFIDVSIEYRIIPKKRGEWMNVLMTGFDPFNGEVVNPSFEAIRAMPETVLGYEVIKLEVPTVFDRAIQVLAAAMDAHRPDIVICVGQAGGRFAITPEYVAINLDEARIPDNEGNKPDASPIVAGGENAYFTTLPVRAIVTSLREAGIPATLSYTAGTFVCNHLFYGLMHLIEKDYPSVRGGFIHVPFLPGQVVTDSNKPFMTLEMMTSALTLAVQTTIKNHQDIALNLGQEH